MRYLTKLSVRHEIKQPNIYSVDHIQTVTRTRMNERGDGHNDESIPLHTLDEVDKGMNNPFRNDLNDWTILSTTGNTNQHKPISSIHPHFSASFMKLMKDKRLSSKVFSTNPSIRRKPLPLNSPYRPPNSPQTNTILPSTTTTHFCPTTITANPTNPTNQPVLAPHRHPLPEQTVSLQSISLTTLRAGESSPPPPRRSSPNYTYRALWGNGDVIPTTNFEEDGFRGRRILFGRIGREAYAKVWITVCIVVFIVAVVIAIVGGVEISKSLSSGNTN